MTEFKQIPQALKYEIDKEGSVQTIKKQTQIIPYPLGGRVVNLDTNDGKRKSFNVDELVSEIFDVKVKPQVVVKEATPVSEPTKEKETVTIKPDAKKIMALKTFMSVKIWKLHKIGLSNSDICDIVKYPNSANVPSTIENYKKSQKLRDKSDKIKV